MQIRFQRSHPLDLQRFPESAAFGHNGTNNGFLWLVRSISDTDRTSVREDVRLEACETVLASLRPVRWEVRWIGVCENSVS